MESYQILFLLSVYSAIIPFFYFIFYHKQINKISLNGNMFTQQYTYSITDWLPGEYSFKTVLDDMLAFSGAGFDWKARMLIAFLIIFGIVALAAKGFGAMQNPEPAIMLFLSLVLFFSFIGWLAIPTDMFNFPSWGVLNPSNYVIFILTLLLGGAYLIQRQVSS